MRVFSYIRYSSQNQQGNTTVETQRQAISNFVAAMPELKRSPIVERRDEGKSATTLRGRAALEGIIREAATGDALVVFKYDRLGRNLLDSLLIIKALEERGIQVYSTSEPNTEVVRNVLLTMAQEFSRQLGDRCKKALDKRASEGHAANKPPYGYEIKSAGHNAGKKFVPVPDEARVVAQMFQQRADGRSFREIARAMNTEGLLTKKGNLWSRSTVRAILKNECYLGKTISGIRRFKKGHGLQETRKRSDWAIGINAHEALITQDVWDAVRARDESSQHEHACTPKRQTKFAWSGFLKCRDCGSNLIRWRSKGRIYYGCDGGRRCGQGRPCRRNTRVRVEAVDANVSQLMKDRVFNEEWVQKVIGFFRSKINELTHTSDDVLVPLQDQHRRLNQQIETATKRMVFVPEELMPQVQSEIAKLRHDRDELAKRIEEAQSRSGKLFDLKEMEQRLRERLDRLWRVFEVGDPIEARNEISKHVDRIEVGKGRRATGYFKADGLLEDLRFAGLELVNQQELVAPADSSCGNAHIPSRLRTLSVPEHHVRFNVWSYKIA